MFIKILAMIAAVAAGAFIAFQSPINAKLGSIIGGPLVAAFISFLIGTIFLGILLLVTRQFPDLSQLSKTQIWMFVGGLLGAGMVFTTLSVVPILGSALMVSLLVTGQMMSALYIDKTGFLLPQSYDISWERILGATLVVIGMILITRTTTAP